MSWSARQSQSRMFCSVAWLFGGVGRLDTRLRRERPLRDPIEAEGLSSELDVVGDIGLLAHELVRLDDETLDVGADDGGRQIQSHGWQKCGHKPADARRDERRQNRGDCPEPPAQWRPAACRSP